MPNWCSNTLAVHGPTDMVELFIKENKAILVGPEYGMADGETRELPLSFNAALPTPDQSKFTDQSYQATENEPDFWYNWNVKNWGTKWDLGDETYFECRKNDDGNSTALYTFETAWAPPESWLSMIAEMYPQLSIKLEYVEEGMGFSGHIGFYMGQMVENEHHADAFHTDVDLYGEMYGEPTELDNKIGEAIQDFSSSMNALRELDN
jgi:Ferredoxin-like domain in Api92-like protein